MARQGRQGQGQTKANGQHKQNPTNPPGSRQELKFNQTGKAEGKAKPGSINTGIPQ